MYCWGVRDLITIVPESIKLEILKKKLIEVYNEEKSSKDIYNANSEAHWFLELLQSANLSDDGLMRFYKFAKMTRKELELPDNLFNITPSIIERPKDYEELNKEINKRNILK